LADAALLSLAASPAASASHLLVVALGFLQLSPRAPELLVLHQWLDSWTGLGLIAVGLHRQGWDLQLTQYGDGNWRATPSKGLGVALE
jgi:hypothetical protein